MAATASYTYTPAIAANLFDRSFLDTMLGMNNDKKLVLVQLLVNSMSVPSAPAESKAALLNRVCGAWKDNGHTSDEDIAMICGARQQETTRQMAEL